MDNATQTETLNVADTILSQLGGYRFIAMTGARDIMGSADSLSFKLPRAGKARISAVTITLLADDTYLIEFYAKTGRFEWAPVATISDIQAAQLRATFTQFTGLYTSL